MKPEAPKATQQKKAAKPAKAKPVAAPKDEPGAPVQAEEAINASTPTLADSDLLETAAPSSEPEETSEKDKGEASQSFSLFDEQDK